MKQATAEPRQRTPEAEAMARLRKARRKAGMEDVEILLTRTQRETLERLATAHNTSLKAMIGALAAEKAAEHLALLPQLELPNLGIAS